jgi:hypothetical protein
VVQSLPRFRTKKTLARVAFLMASLILFSWRLIRSEPNMNARGAAIWFEITWLVLLYGFILFAVFGLGRLAVRHLGIPTLTRFELLILEWLLGLGVLSLGIMALGFAGWLNPWLLLLWLGIAGVLAVREMNKSDPRRFDFRLPRKRDPHLILLQLIILIAIPLLLVECVSPVWDYDAQLYHLQGPRQFLAQGQIAFNSEILRSAYPYLGEMPFLVGLAFDAASLAKLVNFSYAVLFMLSAYALGRRFFGRQTAYTAAGILIGGPAFWMWSTWAGVDFAWADYEFWSLYAIMMWLANNRKDAAKWMRLAGLMSGLAVGVKYLSFPSLLIVVLIILWKSAANSKQPLRDVLTNLKIFSSYAALAGGAWYLRNWISTGDPVYPLILGGPGWEPLEALVLNDYVGSFGAGKTWLDYLLLPYNVYAQHNRFSTIGIEWIHPVLWLAVLAPFWLKPIRRYSVLIVYACLGFGVWLFTSQIIRFLLPLTAILAVLSGAVIESFRSFAKNLLKIGLVGGLMLFNLVFQLQWLQEKAALRYLSGGQSHAEFLREMSYGYETIEFIHATLDVDQAVQFLWDGRGYYCNERCVADDEQSGAILLANGNPPPPALVADLREKGVTHLLLSEPYVTWFMVYHDPRGLHRDALRYFEEEFFPACGRLIHESSGMRLYEIVCR